MYIRIESSNDNFLDIIQKNPNFFNGIKLESIREGIGIGRIISENIYEMYFSDNDNSYAYDKNSVLDFQGLVNPRVGVDLLNVFMKHFFASDFYEKEIPWLNTKNKNVDISSDISITINSILIDNNYGLKFLNYFYKDEISITELGMNLFSLKIKSFTSMFNAINSLFLSLVMIAGFNHQRWMIGNKDFINKTLNIFENVSKDKDIPYFCIYLYSLNFLYTRELFNYSKNKLEDIYKDNLSIEFGNTQTSRLNKIKDILLDGKGRIYNNIIEIGCNSGHYPTKLLSFLEEGYSWQSHDKEDFDSLNFKIQNPQFKFVKTFDDIESFEDATLLLIEVIEHMDFNESKDFISKIFDKFKPKTFIITTPNLTFNQYYKLKEKDFSFRHLDHKFELTTEEFKSLMSNYLGEEYNGRFFQIGDIINNEASTNGFIFKRNS